MRGTAVLAVLAVLAALWMPAGLSAAATGGARVARGDEMMLRTLAQDGARHGICRLRDEPLLRYVAFPPDVEGAPGGQWEIEAAVHFRTRWNNQTMFFEGTMHGDAPAREDLAPIPDGFHGEAVCEINPYFSAGHEFRMNPLGHRADGGACGDAARAEPGRVLGLAPSDATAVVVGLMVLGAVLCFAATAQHYVRAQQRAAAGR